MWMGYACLSVFERHAVSSASVGTPSLRSSELLWWWWSCEACPRKLRSHCVRNGEKLCADGGLIEPLNTPLFVAHDAASLVFEVDGARGGCTAFRSSSKAG